MSGGLIDSGSDYCAQNLMPVYVAAPARGAVNVEVTAIANGERRVTRVSKVESRELT